MTLNFKHNKDKLYFIPLGGAGEIGMNVNLYHYEGKWIMVDCGAGFADDYLPGIDMMVADLSFVATIKQDLIALILTHAHEDHLGAVQYLWDELECPIYTTTFTANFLRNRISEYNFEKELRINEVKPGSKLNLDPFNIEMVPLTHSAPEMQALMIRTKAGNILHTGDWKFDHNPLIGEANDEELLRKLGEEGVLALVCDSTNVFNKNVSGSEGDLRKSLVDIIAGCPQMVVVTTFASNLARLETLIHAAEQAGRKVVISGRSIHRIIKAAKDSGYLQNVNPFVDERDLGKHSRKDLLVIATGCQGEPLAAMNKIATDAHPTLRLAPRDTIIFSSKIIPGNEKRIFRLFNIFVKKGLEVITEKDHFVHVSGHPSAEELEKMYALINPVIAVPVHGELVHIHEHAKLARSWGAKHAIEVENGSVVELSRENPKIVSKVESGYLAIDGNYLLPSDSPVLKARRRLRESGVVVVTLILNAKNKLHMKPIISTPGILDRNEDKELLSIIEDEIVQAFNSMTFPKGLKGNDEKLENVAKAAIRKILKSEMGKNPIMDINIRRVQ